MLTDVTDACGQDPTWACRRVFDATGNEGLAAAVDLMLGVPFRILVIVVVAFVVNRIVRRAIRRFTERVVNTAKLLSSGQHTVRAASRAQTVGAVLRSFSTSVIYGIALVTILGELGINLGPLIASAGIAGVAIGFGAQSLVKDVLTGVFMLVEDQYGVGDIVDLGEATGTVEGVTLRTTRVRDVEGTLWFVPNGQIMRVGNKSQAWARALLDVSIAYGADVRRAEEIIKQTADGLYEDPDWQGRILEPPEVWGVESITAQGVDIRLVVKTRPAEQFAVMRELRVRIKEALDAAGIERPFVQKTVLVTEDPKSSVTANAGSTSGTADPEPDPDGP